MKQSLSFFLVTLLLVCSLTACGKDQKKPENSSTSYPSAETNTQKPSAETDDKTILEDAGDDVIQGAKDVGRAAKDGLDDVGDAARDMGVGTSYDQMKENARVHDRDGKLTDRENTATPGSTH